MNLHVKQPYIEAEDDRGARSFVGEYPSFDIPALYRILRARHAIVVGTVVMVLGLTLLVFSFIVPLYFATAVVILDQRKNTVADVNSVLAELPTDPASIQSQIQILTSRQLALSVVEKLKLDRDPEFNADLTQGLPSIFGWTASSELSSDHLRIGLRRSDADRDGTINRLLERLSVKQIGLSTALAISVGSVDAQKSTRITNVLANAYVDGQLNAKFEATEKATRWLSERVRQLAAQVQSDETAVQQYRTENGIVDTPGGGSINDQQIVNVSSQLINAKVDLAQKLALYNRVVKLQRSGRASDASQVIASPLIAELRSQQADLTRQAAQLSSRYGENHPKMADIQSQRDDTKAKLAIEVRRVVESFSNDVAVGRASVASLQSNLDQLKSMSQTQNNASVSLKALEMVATSSRSMYEALLSRLKETQGQEGIATPDARVISRATVPTTPTPSVMLLFGVATFASLALGLVLAFVAERLDSSFRTKDQAEGFLGLHVLTTVPEIANVSADRKVPELVVYEPSSSFAESIRGLHLGLALSNVNEGPKVVMVTSAVPGEGKTTIAISLARLAARKGRTVVIVDADFRHPSVARTMGISSDVDGIGEVLTGRLTLDQCLVSDKRSLAVVLACREKLSNPSDLLSSDGMETLVVRLRSRYDLVIIDSAPLLPVHDTWTLSRLSDTTLLVAQCGKTPREAVACALRSLKSMNVSVAGVALTRAKLDPRHAYRDYLTGTAYRSESPPSEGWRSNLPSKMGTAFFRACGVSYLT